MAASERPESWPGVPGLTADYLAAEDIDISVVLRGIGLSQSRIDSGLRALERVSTAYQQPFKFRLAQHVNKFARGLKLREEGLGRLEEAAFEPLILALLGRGAGALSTFTHVVLTYDYLGFAPTLLDEDMTASLCANLGHQSSKVRDLDLDSQDVFATERGCELLAAALRSNRCLKELYLNGTGLESKGVKLLVSGLKENQTLELLNIGLNKDIGDEGTGYVAELLKDNTSLNFLRMHFTGMTDGGAGFLSSALARNTKLRTLDLGNNRIGKNGLTRLLDLLTPASDAHGPDGPNNTTLTCVELSNFLEFPVESMALMIERNTSLIKLGIAKAPLSSYEWVRHIIPALKKNSTLRELDASGSEGVAATGVLEAPVDLLSGSEGVTATGVLEALVDLLRTSNTALELINVVNTPLSKAGMAGRLAEELRMSKEYRSKFKGQPTRTPVCGRLVLCGYEFSGKTTICKTMRSVIDGKPNFHGGRMAYKNFLRKHPGLRQCLYGEQAPRELEERTRGYEIVVLRNESDRRSTIWDFAGQKEYYVLHHFVLPNARNTCFLFVCSAVYPAYHIPQQRAGKPKSQQDMEKEFFYWLRFLASNAKPGTPPRVVFVLTNKDFLGRTAQVEKSRGWADNVVADMEEKFGSDIHFLEGRAVVVNAQSLRDITVLLERVEGGLKDLLAEGVREFKVCEDVRLALEEWAAGHPSNPIIKMEEFRSLCQGPVKRAMDDLPVGADGRNPVLAYLNDVGDIIFPGKRSNVVGDIVFPEKPALDFIVVNPTWFGRGVLGSLIDACRRTREGSHSRGLIGYVKDCLPGGNDVLRGLSHQHGFVLYSHLEELLKTSLRTTHLTGIITTEDLIALMIELEMCFKENPKEEKSRLFIPAVFDDDDELAAKGKRKPEWKLDRRGGTFQHVGRRLQCANKALTFLSPGFFPRLQVVLRNYYYSEEWTDNPAFQVDRNLIGFAHDGHEIIVEYSGDIDCFVDIVAKSTQSYSRTLRFIEENVMKKIREFCASPQGCQGVVLVDAVIRLICVEKLHTCAERIDDAVLVSTLEENLAKDPDEKSCKHTWKRQIQDVAIEDYVLDLLEGEGSYSNFKASLRHTRSILQVPLEDLGSPRHIFITEKDVQWTYKMLAKVRVGRVVPFRFHLRCECRHREHPIDGQDGRIFYVVDRHFPMEELIRLGVVKTARAVLKAGNSKAPGLAGVADFLLYEETPVYCDTIESLSTQCGTAGDTISNEALRVQVEKNMQNSRAGAWMTAFLNFGPGAKEIQKFRNDFLLMEVEYLASSSTNSKAWVCETHCNEGVDQRTLRRII